MKKLANEIYNKLLDMDYMDYQETIEKDSEDLLEDLELLNQNGNGALLNAIKMMIAE